MTIIGMCTRLRERVELITGDLPALRSRVAPADLLAPHLIDRVIVASDNAKGCVVLAEHHLAAPLATVGRSIFESLLASYWASQSDENAAMLLDAMPKEMMRIMVMNLKRGHGEIVHKETGEVCTQTILEDPRTKEASRPLSPRKMADQCGLGKLYDMTYGMMSMFAHGTATELLTDPDQTRMISGQIAAVGAYLRCIHLIASNRILEWRVTRITELESILKIPLS